MYSVVMEWCCFSFRRTCQVLLPPLQDTTVCIKADLPATEPSPDYSIPYSARIVPAGLFPFVCVFFLFLFPSPLTPLSVMYLELSEFFGA